MLWVLFWLATTVGGLSENDVILSNQTGLAIIRIEIGSRKLEGSAAGPVADTILVSVPPGKHHLRLVFRGGADVDWPHFNWQGVHEVIFLRVHNRIEARVE